MMPRLRGAAVVLCADVGYSLAEFVVERAGTDGLRTLVLASGDTFSALGLTTDAFEREWHNFIRTRYLGG